MSKEKQPSDKQQNGNDFIANVSNCAFGKKRKIMREQHIDFIRKDLKERGEIPTSNITFFGAIYSLKVKKEGDKRAKTVTYSAAQNVLRGYRAISV